MSFTSKKTVFFISAIVFLVLVTIVIVAGKRNSNTDVNDEESYYVPETIIFDDEISEPVYEGMPEGISYRRVGTKITTDTKTGSRLAMTYPVFSGFGDADNDINELIQYYNETMKRIHGSGMEKMLGRNIEVVYEVNDFMISYIDSELISIVYNGMFSSFAENDHIDTGNYYFKYSLNIDVKNKKVITSDEIISNYLLMKSRIMAGEMKTEYLIDDYFEYFTYYDMLVQYGDAYKNYPMLYFTKERLNIIIALTPDVGGHAVFSYNLQDSKEFIDGNIEPLRGLFS